MSNQPIQVLIVDDHAMVRIGMKAFLEEYPDICVAGDAPNGLKAVELVERLKPDVILMDLIMPVMDGIETTQRIIENWPDQRVLILTCDMGEDHLIPAIQAGALGYLKKDFQPEELVRSIRAVYAGEPALNPTLIWKSLRGMVSVETTKRPIDELSEREIEILRLFCKGKTDAEIAERLYLAEVTIRTHINRIITKLGQKNRVQLLLYSFRSGITALEEIN